MSAWSNRCSIAVGIAGAGSVQGQRSRQPQDAGSVQGQRSQQPRAPTQQLLGLQAPRTLLQFQALCTVRATLDPSGIGATGPQTLRLGLLRSAHRIVKTTARFQAGCVASRAKADLRQKAPLAAPFAFFVMTEQGTPAL